MWKGDVVSWFRLDPPFHADPKVIEAGNGAIGAFVRMGCLAMQHETDGLIIAKSAKAIASKRELRALLDVGLITEREDGFQIVNFLRYNYSRAQLTEQREANAKRQSRHRSRNALLPELLTLPYSLSTLPGLQSVSLSRSVPADADDGTTSSVPQVVAEALVAYSLQLADQHAKPGRRLAYSRTVIDHGEDHIPALKTLAFTFPDLNADELAKKYAQNGKSISEIRAPIAHQSDCVCEGNGVVYVNPDDPSEGVIPCPGL
jgi:hypothetical protein